MARLSVAHPTPRLAPVRRLPVADVDHLFELRGLIQRAQDEEQRLTQAILAACQAQGGQRAVAVVGTRTRVTIDPALFLDARTPPRAGADTAGIAHAHDPTPRLHHTHEEASHEQDQ
jgi:hypothetical protein